MKSFCSILSLRPLPNNQKVNKLFCVVWLWFWVICWCPQETCGKESQRQYQPLKSIHKILAMCFQVRPDGRIFQSTCFYLCADEWKDCFLPLCVISLHWWKYLLPLTTLSVTAKYFSNPLVAFLPHAQLSKPCSNLDILQRKAQTLQWGLQQRTRMLKWHFCREQNRLAKI